MTVKQNYIVANQQGVVLSVHRWLVAAIWSRASRDGGAVYCRYPGAPRWWEPMSGVGWDMSYGTLFVSPGFKPEERRVHRELDI